MTEIWRGTYLRVMKEDQWEYVDRHKGRYAAAVFAITEAGEVVMVEQYRTPVKMRLWELPAGLIGDNGSDEEALEAAQRELWEETGYKARRWMHLGRVAISPGMVTEMTDFFLASGLEKQGAGGGDESEDITIHHLPLSGIEDWVEEQRTNGRPIDMKLLTALGLFNASPHRP